MPRGVPNTDIGRPALAYKTARTRKEAVTLERLKSVLRYEPETGNFIRLIRTSNNCAVGDIAGCVDKDTGYVRISIDGVLYHGHRLAWFYMTGEWPEIDVDHENRNTSDNRWSNLRNASRTLNNANRPKRRAGLKGVTEHSPGRWVAQIGRMYKSGYIGIYDTEQEAHEAYRREAERQFGEYARFE